MIWSHHNPVSVVSGVGARFQLPSLLPEGPVLLVTSEGMVRRGMAEAVMSLCADREWTVRTAASNPDLDELDAMALPPAKSVVALGGGSAIDAGKALAAKLANPGAALAEWLRGRMPGTAAMLPLICLPTTAGTGAEVTPFATIWDTEFQKKRSLAGPFLYPRHALLDPELSLSVPWQTTLFCGLDAVSHALESLWNKNATPVSVLLANEALRLAGKALPALEHDLENIALREAMQAAALLAGLAISQTRTAIAHAISYPFTLHFGVPHGLACSFTLPALLRRVDCAGGWAKGANLVVVHDIENMLQHFNVKAKMESHCTFSQAEPFIGEMFTPGRADNFAVSIASTDDVRAILRESL